MSTSLKTACIYYIEKDESSLRKIFENSQQIIFATSPATAFLSQQQIFSRVLLLFLGSSLGH